MPGGPYSSRNGSHGQDERMAVWIGDGYGLGQSVALRREWALWYTPRMSDSGISHHPSAPLKLLPAYLGTDSIEAALATARGRRILWLEILVNDRLDLSPWRNHPPMQEAFQTACRWYSRYSRLITFLFNRAPLPADPGPIDFREYRTFAEALRFAYHHH